MAAGNIWERIVATDHSLPAAHAPISIHTLGAAIIFRATSEINSNTPIVNAFSLDANGQADLDAFRTAYNAQPSAVTKAAWLHLLEASFILVNEGLLTVAQAKTALGIP